MIRNPTKKERTNTFLKDRGIEPEGCSRGDGTAEDYHERM
jgi:hypothetical protein